MTKFSKKQKYCSREILKSAPKSSDFFQGSILTKVQNYRKHMLKQRQEKEGPLGEHVFMAKMIFEAIHQWISTAILK